jgi:hypothetical protein
MGSVTRHDDEIVDQSQIVRKLGWDESYYDNEWMNNNLFMSRIFLLNVKNHRIITMENLNEAMRIWTRMFPLLNTTIHRQVDQRTGQFKLGSPKYFIRMKKSVDEYNNVDLIDLTESNNWMDVIYNELKTPFDIINGPLWRIKLLKLKNPAWNYGFVLAKNHALGDGRCTYTFSLAYLNILSDVLEGKVSQYEHVTPIESKVNMDELIRKLKSNPDFKIIPKNECDHVLNRIPKNPLYKETSSSPPFNDTRLTYLKLDKEKVERLHKKSKSNASKAKLTGILALLTSYSYHQACLKHKLNDIPLDSVQFDNLVSFRPKFGIENGQMGVFSHCLECKFDFSQEPKTKGDFWCLAELDSVSFHERIRNNEEFFIYETNQDETIQNVNSNFDFSNNTYTNFMFSNLGVMSNTKEESCVQIVEHYAFLPALANRVGPFLFFGLTTIDGQLFVAISYNQKLFSDDLIKDLKRGFLEKVDWLIED